MGWRGRAGRRRREGTRTRDAHRERLAAVHEVVELQRLEEARLPELLARLGLGVLEELPVDGERAHALVEADLRLLRPLRGLCQTALALVRKGKEARGRRDAPRYVSWRLCSSPMIDSHLLRFGLHTASRRSIDLE